MVRHKYSKARAEQIADTSRQMRLNEDAIAEQTLSPQSLARDRGTTAQEITYNVGEWIHRTQYLDFRGADVHRESIDPKKRKSAEDLVDDPNEANRLIQYIDGTKDGTQRPIRNFAEFKEAFKQSFTKSVGGNHGVRLWDRIGGQEDLLLRLYAHTHIQEMVSRDSRAERVVELKARYHITDDRKANRLFEQVRIHEIQLIQEGMLPVDERQGHTISPAISPIIAPRTLRISQRAHTGTLYNRAKPLPFNRPQERFLLNNRAVPIRKLTAQFNILFGGESIPVRTQSSIGNKRYRLQRGE